MEKTMNIKHSMDYDMFNLLPSINRKIESNRVTKMRQSIQKMG